MTWFKRQNHIEKRRGHSNINLITNGRNRGANRIFFHLIVRNGTISLRTDKNNVDTDFKNFFNIHYYYNYANWVMIFNWRANAPPRFTTNLISNGRNIEINCTFLHLIVRNDTILSGENNVDIDFRNFFNTHCYCNFEN